MSTQGYLSGNWNATVLVNSLVQSEFSVNSFSAGLTGCGFLASPSIYPIHLGVQVVLLDPQAHETLRQAQKLGRPRLIAVGCLERIFDQSPLHVFERCLQ